MTKEQKIDQEFIEHCDLIMDLSADVAHAIRDKDWVASERYMKEKVEATRAFYKWYKEKLLIK